MRIPRVALVTALLLVLGALAAPAAAQGCSNGRNVYWEVDAMPDPLAAASSHRIRTVFRDSGEAVAPTAAEQKKLLAEFRLELPNPNRGSATFRAYVRFSEVWKDCDAPSMGTSGPTPWRMDATVTKAEADARAGELGTSAIVRLPDYGSVAWPRWAVIWFDAEYARALGRNF